MSGKFFISYILNLNEICVTGLAVEMVSVIVLSKNLLAKTRND